MKARCAALLVGICVFQVLTTGGLAVAQELSKQDFISKLQDNSASATRSLSGGNANADSAKDMPDFVKDGVARGLKIEERKQLDTYVTTYQRPVLNIVIAFDLNSYEISKNAEKVLIELAAALVAPELKDSKFALGGHTDSSGSAAHNQKLSEQRALAVKTFLSAYKVQPERLIAAGYGEERPKQGLDPANADNRRVEIVNLGTY
jgi:outer membrane protein OmpA-like peptidoglycan-associated protein